MTLNPKFLFILQVRLVTQVVKMFEIPLSNIPGKKKKKILIVLFPSIINSILKHFLILKFSHKLTKYSKILVMNQ